MIRDLPKKKLTKVLQRLLSDILKREDDYIETSLIEEKSSINSQVISVQKYLFCFVFLFFALCQFLFRHSLVDFTHSLGRPKAGNH